MSVEFDHGTIGLDQLGGVLAMAFGFRIEPHGSKFETSKRCSLITDALLPEKNRALSTQFDDQRDGCADQQYGGGNQENEKQIERSFPKRQTPFRRKSTRFSRARYLIGHG